MPVSAIVPDALPDTPYFNQESFEWYVPPGYRHPKCRHCGRILYNKKPVLNTLPGIWCHCGRCRPEDGE